MSKPLPDPHPSPHDGPLRGHCLCGNITYTVTGSAQKASVCHCSQCRRQSGHLWASAQVMEEDISIDGDSLAWYRATSHAQRGFCSACGSFLFWQLDGEGAISFSLGSLDKPTGITLEKHILVADKGDYYTITDNLPQKD